MRPRRNRLEAGTSHTAAHGRHVTWLAIVYKVGLSRKSSFVHSADLCRGWVRVRVMVRGRGRV